MRPHYYPAFTFKAGMLALKEPVSSKLAKEFSISRICTIDQQSSDAILQFDYKDINQLAAGHSVLGAADALIVNNYQPAQQAVTLIGITTADCLPIIIQTGNKIALIHAGWRGLALGLIQKTISILRNSSEAEFKVLIASAAKGCCYEVGTEVLEALHFGTGLPKRKIDLQTEATIIIQKLLSEAEITFDSRCTICSKELHSFRRDKTELRNLSFVII